MECWKNGSCLADTLTIAADRLSGINTIRPNISQIQCVCPRMCVRRAPSRCADEKRLLLKQTFFSITCCSSECETRSQLFGPRSLLSLLVEKAVWANICWTADLDKISRCCPAGISFYASPPVRLIVGWIFYTQYRIPLKVMFSIFCRPKLWFCVHAPSKTWYFCLFSPFSGGENKLQRCWH